jgi:hypothetical protein
MPRNRRSFGADTAALVAGVARMEEIRALPSQGDADERAAQAERLRKMLLAMVEDIRVVLIKLAERTAALRYLMGGGVAMREPRERAAREVLDLFAPLANRLGVWQLKWELEDLSLRALEPETYKTIASMLDERRLDRQRYIEDVIATLRRELDAAGIKAEVTGRPKHIYSIWNKMRRKQSGIDALYDIRAVRILVDDVKACYTALGIVHHLWSPLPREFDDYIAKPKANSYRSLHTAVIGPEGKPLEVQIRTFEMHQHSEYGVAAHWRYKEGTHKGVRRDPAFEDRIGWLRQVLDWKDAVADASEWLAAFKSSLFTDTIYVLTPQGRVVDLPRGATPVDFAYAVHTSLGHRCRGARVDGAMAPLNQVLKNGQQVEIIAAKQGGPSRDWLNAELGYVASHRARTRSANGSGAAARGNAGPGRAVVERELARGRDRGQSRRRGREGRIREGRGTLRRGRSRRAQHPAHPSGDSGGRPSGGSSHNRARAGGPREAEQGGRCGERHPRRRRRSADDEPGALLQAGAAGSDCRIRHARQGGLDPPAQLHERRADARARARAPDRRRLGQTARRGVSGGRGARGDGSPGLAARHHGDLLARADQRDRREYAHPKHAVADDVHARGQRSRRAQPLAPAGSATCRASFRRNDAERRRARLRTGGGPWISQCRQRPLVLIVESDRTVGGNAEFADQPVRKRINPGMHREQLPALPSVLDDRRPADMDDLFDDVELAEAVDARIVRAETFVV